MCNISHLTWVIGINQYLDIGDTILFIFPSYQFQLFIIAQQQFYIVYLCYMCVCYQLGWELGLVITTIGRYAARIHMLSTHNGVATTQYTLLTIRFTSRVVTVRATSCLAQLVLFSSMEVRRLKHSANIGPQEQ